MLNPSQSWYESCRTLDPKLEPHNPQPTKFPPPRTQVHLSSLLLSSIELSVTIVYEPHTRALIGTASHFCELPPPAHPGSINTGVPHSQENDLCLCLVASFCLSLPRSLPLHPKSQLHRARHMTRAIGFNGFGELRPSARLTAPLLILGRRRGARGGGQVSRGRERGLNLAP